MHVSGTYKALNELSSFISPPSFLRPPAHTLYIPATHNHSEFPLHTKFYHTSNPFYMPFSLSEIVYFLYSPGEHFSSFTYSLCKTPGQMSPL